MPTEIGSRMAPGSQ